VAKSKSKSYLLPNRDISWLSFNARVLQEAKDKRNSLYNKIRFLGIYSNNTDEFFRVRVATLNRLAQVQKPQSTQAKKLQQLLIQINEEVASQQKQFNSIFKNITQELQQQNIFLITNKQLDAEQCTFVEAYFAQTVRSFITPIMIESIATLPLLKDKLLYLACALGHTQQPLMCTYCLIDIPTTNLDRFVLLPTKGKKQFVILLEDVIRHCLPHLFAQFGFNQYSSSIIKLTRDAEIDYDSELKDTMISKLERGIKNRKKGKAVRFIYEQNIDKRLLNYLLKLLSLSKKDTLLPSGKIHNFKDFMNFPKHLFDTDTITQRPKSFTHKALEQPVRILGVLDAKDILLHFPYHSFDSIIDLLREASIDPYVQDITITCYRLARNSKIINALINAQRNSKKVTVILELKARFDEQANLYWKTVLEEEGIVVIVSEAHYKIHAKLCLITKKEFGKQHSYAFVSTGNLNEDTSKVYSDACLLTSRKSITKEVLATLNAIIKNNTALPKANKHLILSPHQTRNHFIQLINNEIKNYKAGHEAQIIFKLNSLSDTALIQAIIDAVKAGVPTALIIRSIYCVPIIQAANFKAISIVDTYLEHARIAYFGHKGKPKVYIGSADFMTRNLDHRIEACVQIIDPILQQELYNLLMLQLVDNQKARNLNNAIQNSYAQIAKKQQPLQSQIGIFKYLQGY
jgi:polyphosphate kinase